MKPETTQAAKRRGEENKKIVEENSLKNILNFVFLNQKQELKPYEVEVYDTHDTFFYGYDLKAQRTKQFAYDRMFDVIIGKSFVPRSFNK